MFQEIRQCRICGNSTLIPLINMGEQYLTGVFPRKKGEKITSGPLELVKCIGDGGDTCGLVQLRHSYSLAEMYGDNYGYRSSLNRSMIEHLHGKVRKISTMVGLNRGDLILDIGSNDSTLLRGYERNDLERVGIDPTGRKFREFYPETVTLIPEFFSSELFRGHFGNRKARVVTSIAMFYDLETPMEFMRQVHDILADDGIWVFEQSYMPAMLRMNAYDTICHEHLEYYSLKQIKWMTDRTGFKIIDLEFNAVNGGSFSLAVAKKDTPFQECSDLITEALRNERDLGLGTLRPYQEFRDAVFRHRDDLIRFIHDVNADGKLMLGYGASTKGNVILQFCNLGERDIRCIAEVNKDKFGCFTPGTNIPIVSEDEARAMNPDYFLVLPWHFRDGIVRREQSFLDRGGKIVMPLPEIEVIGK